MKKVTLLVPAAFLLAGCNLLPSAPITGNNTQKALRLSQIISSGGQADCKITSLADNTTTEIIVSGKKMKFIGSDFGQGKKGTMINDTVYNYIWSDGDKTGIKTKVEVPTSPTPTITGTEPTPADTSKEAAVYEDESKYKMDCAQRVILDSEFTPPADVQFTDIAAMMKAVPSVPKMPSGVKVPTSY